MASYNRVILVGNLTRDPETKDYGGGQLCKFSLAINEKVKKGNDWVDETLFVDVTLFGKTADIAARYLTKGSSCLIEGRLRQERWEKDGVKHQKMTVTGDKLQLLGSKNGGGSSQSSHPTSESGVGDSYGGGSSSEANEFF
jgi:single-strand DNA-binding protein